MSVPLKYVNAKDLEAAEMILIAQLQQTGYRTGAHHRYLIQLPNTPKHFSSES